MMQKIVCLWIAVLIVSAGFMVDRALAEKAWNGTSGLWSDANAWTPTGVPGDGDDVTLPAGTYTLTLAASSSNLLSYTQQGGTLSFTNWTTALKATTVTIVTGNVECIMCDTSSVLDNISRVWIVATNLIVGTNGSINVDGRGFRGGVEGILDHAGQGDGGATHGLAAGTAGAGYGGAGGEPYYDGVPGPVYGSIEAPTDPGSGGAGHSTLEGGSGGGAIRLEVGEQLTVHGTITANGNEGSGAGSGGGIYISCLTVAGNGGTIRANGGRGSTSTGSGGGGGRVAICYDAGEQVTVVPAPVMTISASHGCQNGYYSWPIERDGSVGTVFFTDSQLMQPAIGDNGGGQFMWGANSSVLNLDSLAITDSRSVFFWRDATHNFSTWVEFPDVRTLVVSNNVILNNAKLVISNCVMQVGGSLTATNFVRFYVYAGETNSGTATYGALVSVSNQILIADNSWVFPVSDSTNGGSALFRMTDLNITTTNAGFNANSFGYHSVSTNSWYLPPWGYGPGSGGYDSGGGYGGQGGYTYGGGTYGNSNAPAQCGSAGGGHGNIGYPGGGLVWIEASGAVNVQGSISARGYDYSHPNKYSGAGSGGGIFIRCVSFSGGTDAELNAQGGYSGLKSGGGGGGGRIAVWTGLISDQNAERIISGQLDAIEGNLMISTNDPNVLVNIDVAGGPSNVAQAGEPGTIVFISVSPPYGTVISIR